jgi:hypothetical protein
MSKSLKIKPFILLIILYNSFVCIAPDIVRIRNSSHSQILTASFPEKVLWFRSLMDSMRIPWTSGCDNILVNLNRIIEDSITFLSFCDLHKEIKVHFEGDVVKDAGGLLREWVFLTIRELFEKKQGLFFFLKGLIKFLNGTLKFNIN